jgi:hypothetical protein
MYVCTYVRIYIRTHARIHTRKYVCILVQIPVHKYHANIHSGVSPRSCLPPCVYIAYTFHNIGHIFWTYVWTALKKIYIYIYIYKLRAHTHTNFVLTCVFCVSQRSRKVADCIHGDADSSGNLVWGTTYQMTWRFGHIFLLYICIYMCAYRRAAWSGARHIRWHGGSDIYFFCIYVYIYVCVCVFVCDKYICICIHVYGGTDTFAIRAHNTHTHMAPRTSLIYICMYVCICICMYICICIYTYILLFCVARSFVWFHVFYIYIYIYIYIVYIIL